MAIKKDKKCIKCNHKFEFKYIYGEPNDDSCPKCGGESKTILSSPTHSHIKWSNRDNIK